MAARGGLAHPAGAFGIGEGRDEGRGQFTAVAGFDQPAGLAGDQGIGDGAGAAADDGPAAGHRFEHGAAGAVGTRHEQDGHIQGGIGFRQVVFAVIQAAR